MINYLLELSLVHLVLMLSYLIILRNERQYERMRLYLLGAALLALIIPLLKLPELFVTSADPAMVYAMESIPIREIPVTMTMEKSDWNFGWLIWIYLVVSLFLLIRFIQGIFQIVLLKQRSSPATYGDLKVLKSKEINGSFAFLNWIFLSDRIDPLQNDYLAILKHEYAHTRLGHTYDILFLQLFRIFFWWLPSSWLNLIEIKKIHEYQADAFALKSCPVDQYTNTLIHNTLKPYGIDLVSSFHDGLILKRIKAMRQKATKISFWKIGALSSLSAFLFIVFACTEEVNRELQEISHQSNTINFEQLPPAMQDELQELKAELSYLRIDGYSDENAFKIKELQNLDPDLIHTVNVLKADNAVYVALKKDRANFETLSDRSKMQGEVFVIVEDQPQYEGGMDAFYQYVAREMTYPKVARQQGVEGTVNVQFVVEKDGTLSNVIAAQGIGSGCDEEAVRVVRNAKAFKPGSQRGKKVRVRMSMPIVFKLDLAKRNPDDSVQGMIIVEKAETQKNKFKISATYEAGAWSGTIYDETGEPLPGANIVIKGTTMGTVSDLDGSFRLSAHESQEPYVSFVGYETVKLEKG